MKRSTYSRKKRSENVSANVNELLEYTSKKDRPIYNFPIGTHVLNIPKSIASRLRSFAIKHESVPSLTVSRVWIEKKKGRYIFHIGDLEDIVDNK